MVNPQTKAQNISQKFYKLSRPVQGSNVTTMLFGTIKHPLNDSVALVIDTNYHLPKGTISAAHITDYITNVYPTITTTQRNTITNYINSNTLIKIARIILTARIKLWKYSELEARGWFTFPNPF